MISLPSRHGAFTLMSAAGYSLGWLFGGLPAVLPARAAAQTADPAPAAQSAAGVPALGTVQTDAKGRHLAPHDTFFLLSYVSVTTDTGVEGFVPGQEVHLVEVHRPTHTLVVTDGKAQVEVPPAKLTNDLDIAALVRQQDEANQAQIATYVQAQEAAYAKNEHDQAEQAAKDEERQKTAQAAEATLAGQTGQVQGVPAAGQPVEASFGGNGYYGSGGEGYGSPYAYFVGGAVSGVHDRANRASGPGGGRGTLPSNQANSANGTELQPGTAAGAAHAGGGGGHPGGGKP